MHASQVGQHFSLCPNFELRKRRHYPIIPTGMRYQYKRPVATWPPINVSCITGLLFTLWWGQWLMCIFRAVKRLISLNALIVPLIF